MVVWLGRKRSSSEERRLSLDTRLFARLVRDDDGRNLSNASSCFRFFIFLLDGRDWWESKPVSKSSIRREFFESDPFGEWSFNWIEEENMTHGDASTIDQGSTRNDDDQKEQKTSEGPLEHIIQVSMWTAMLQREKERNGRFGDVLHETRLLFCLSKSYRRVFWFISLLLFSSVNHFHQSELATLEDARFSIRIHWG